MRKLHSVFTGAVSLSLLASCATQSQQAAAPAAPTAREPATVKYPPVNGVPYNPQVPQPTPPNQGHVTAPPTDLPPPPAATGEALDQNCLAMLRTKGIRASDPINGVRNVRRGAPDDTVVYTYYHMLVTAGRYNDHPARKSVWGITGSMADDQALLRTAMGGDQLDGDLYAMAQGPQFRMARDFVRGVYDPAGGYSTVEWYAKGPKLAAVYAALRGTAGTGCAKTVLAMAGDLDKYLNGNPWVNAVQMDRERALDKGDEAHEAYLDRKDKLELAKEKLDENEEEKADRLKALREDVKELSEDFKEKFEKIEVCQESFDSFFSISINLDEGEAKSSKDAIEKQYKACEKEVKKLFSKATRDTKRHEAKLQSIKKEREEMVKELAETDPETKELLASRKKEEEIIMANPDAAGGVEEKIADINVQIDGRLKVKNEKQYTRLKDKETEVAKMFKESQAAATSLDKYTREFKKGAPGSLYETVDRLTRLSGDEKKLAKYSEAAQKQYRRAYEEMQAAANTSYGYRTPWGASNTFESATVNRNPTRYFDPKSYQYPYGL